MSALAQAHVPSPGPSPGPGPDPPCRAIFRRRVERLVEDYARLWWRTSASTPVLGPPVPRKEQRATARATDVLIDRIARDVESYPDEEGARGAWREELKATLRQFGETRLGWPAGYRNLLVSDEFYETSVAFTRRARRFDADIEAGEIGQALRNVWIVNSLQMLLDRPVVLTPSVFAYSLLYPYTDNYLDDETVPAADKLRFNAGLGRRLAGQAVEPGGRREGLIYRLVEMIEADLPRTGFPAVYESLQAIHRAQGRSLRQQGPAQPLYTDDLLRLSIEKGGTSVLSDGLLVAGAASDDEMDFSFGYGVFLQLLDDLQDIAEDRHAGHQTLFSTTARRLPLDRLTSQLYNFMHRILATAPRFAGRRFADRKDLIRRNCSFLLVGAVAENEELFSRPFLRRLESRWPYRFSALRRLRKAAMKRFGKLRPVLLRRSADGELADLVGSTAPDRRPR